MPRHALTAVFVVHLAVFAALYLRRRKPALLLPIAVFSLLVAVQLLAGHPAARPLRVAAIALAVPSVGVMAWRLVRRLRRRKAPE